MWNNLVRAFAMICPLGVILGSVFFTASLTPSLIPRDGFLQGALAGSCLALGYGLGALMIFIWRWLGLPSWPARHARIIYFLALAFGAVIVIIGLGFASTWQNQVHAAIGLPPVETVRPFTIAGIALVVSAALIGLGRLLRLAKRAIADRLDDFIPRRLALVLGLFITAALTFFVANDLILRQAFVLMDGVYSKADTNTFVDQPAPIEPLRTGSPSSLLDWQRLGAEGRKFVINGPNAETIASITQREALDPLRIYVGGGSAPTAKDRAQLALNEALRVGAFERSLLVIATPTGTGWMDPSAHYPLEVLADGDIATVGVQYSYLPSWLSLIAVSEYGKESARAVFLAFYNHWKDLPVENRPRLYLFGLSLGALNTDLSNDVYDYIDDPYSGIFYAGAPFATPSLTNLISERDEGSPAWLPRLREGDTVRFMNQASLPPFRDNGGETRFLYLQYASDGIVHFSTDLMWRKPEWLNDPRGPDVSPHLVWVPVVTFFQIGFDLLTATSAPKGYGHSYAGRDYMQGWNAVLDTARSNAELERLRRHLVSKEL